MGQTHQFDRANMAVDLIQLMQESIDVELGVGGIRATAFEHFGENATRFGQIPPGGAVRVVFTVTGNHHLALLPEEAARHQVDRLSSVLHKHHVLWPLKISRVIRCALARPRGINEVSNGEARLVNFFLHVVGPCIARTPDTGRILFIIFRNGGNHLPWRDGTRGVVEIYWQAPIGSWPLQRWEIVAKALHIKHLTHGPSPLPANALELSRRSQLLSQSWTAVAGDSGTLVTRERCHP